MSKAHVLFSFCHFHLAGTQRGDAVYSKLPDLSRRGSPMAPIASFDEQGRIEWNEEICENIEQLCREK